MSLFSAVIVTRGDVDLGPALQPLRGMDEIVIRRGQNGVWERFEAALSARHEWIYTQDDDCVVDVGAVLARWEPGLVVCNMPEWKRGEYPDQIALVGWGAVFHRSALSVFARFRQHFPEDDAIFRREADRVFTGLNPLKLIDVPFEHLLWAHDHGRLGAQKEHGEALREIRRRVQVVRNG